MGVPVSYPDKLGFIKNINNYIQSTNRPNTVTGKYLNWLFNAIADLLPTVEATAMWVGVIEQFGGGIPPSLVLKSDGGAGEPVQNTICYNGVFLELTFEYLAPGHYKIVSNIPIFGENYLIGIIFNNNNFNDVGGIVSYGEVKVMPLSPATPFEMEFKTFDGMNGGLTADDLLSNCTLSYIRIE